MRGYIEYLVLIAVVLAFLFAGGFSSFFTDNSSLQKDKYILTTPTQGVSQQTLQLQNLNFQTITLTPSPTLALANNNGGGSSSGSSTGNAFADFATQLVKDITQGCPPVYHGCVGSPQCVIVNGNNRSCINKLSYADVKDQLNRNLNENFNLQCAGFAQAVSRHVGPFFNNGDAASYIGGRAGYKWIPNGSNARIQVGDFPVWECPECFIHNGQQICWEDQHIAVVVSTTPGGTYQFTVAEANGASGTVQFDGTYSVHGGLCHGPVGWMRKL